MTTVEIYGGYFRLRTLVHRADAFALLREIDHFIASRMGLYRKAFAQPGGEGNGDGPIQRFCAAHRMTDVT